MYFILSPCQLILISGLEGRFGSMNAIPELIPTADNHKSSQRNGHNKSPNSSPRTARHHASRISKRVNAVPPSGIRKYFDIAATMEDVVTLGIGEPDFVTPPPILQAGLPGRGCTGPVGHHRPLTESPDSAWSFGLVGDDFSLFVPGQRGPTLV